ncbi:MAG TPA: Ig-like domain-containing protein [Thermoanaerobaculia bacterium]|nr:Ig-like domain-containing protein [Thermoanaerobaculia bacterium]
MSLQCCPSLRTITVFLLVLLALGVTGAVAAPRTGPATPPAAPQPVAAAPPEAVTPNVVVGGGAVSYFTVTPCRVFDSRQPANAPALQTGVARLVQVTGNCGVPADAKLVAVNLTVSQPTAAGTIELYRGDGTATGLADLDFASGQTRANNAVVALAFDGSGTLNALLTTATTGQTSHLILDLNGYFKDVTPVAQDDSYSTTLNTPLNQAAPGVLANDTLNGAAIFSYGATTGAEQTTIGAATPTSAAGSVSLNADGSFNYTPATGFKGNDTFKYVLKNSAGSSTATVTISVGKGNQTINFTSTAPAGAKVGGPTYNVTATASSGLTVAFTIDAAAASVCSISGSTVSFIGVGTCVIDANQAGDANYNAAPQVQQSFAVAKGDQTINFTSTAPAGAKVGGPTYNVTATASSGLAVAFTIDGSAASVCSISGSTVSFIGVGTCVIDANQAGNANYNAAPQAQQSFGVAKGDQTITFTSTAPASAKVGGPTYNVTATASSGLAVTFTIDASATSVCSISGSTVSFTASGTCVIDANQAGNANYNAAPQAQQSFAVGKTDQTINFTSTAPAGAKVGGPTYNVTATATSGLTVAFTIDAAAASVCSISGSTVSFIGPGTCVIDANQAGDATYNAAPQVQQSFAVAKGDQTINFTSTAPAGAKVAGPTYNVTATASSGLTVAFTIDAAAASVCSISGSTVSFIGTGTCVIDANQAGNANYNAAPQAQQSFAVAKGDQTINFTSTAPAGAKVGGPTYNVTATASSGLAVTLTIDASASSVCSISGSTVSFIGAGTCVIDANQAGNANYNAAPQAQQSFAVAKGDQTINFTSTAPAGAKVAGPTYNVTATASSGLAVTFTIDASASSVCSISGSTVSFIGAGTCVIDANQAGNANYNAAPQAQQSFAVAKGDQTITFTSTAPAKVKPGGPTYNVTATASSGLTVAFTIDASATSFCSISGSTVSFTADGTCVIDANQAGNANYNAAPQVQQSILVDAPPTVTSTIPVNNAINVPLASTITINFSKSVNVTGSAFTLACSPSATPAFTVTPASPAATYVLHPTGGLPFDNSCTVTVVANQVTSIANTQMDTNYVFSFATPPIANADTYPETLIGNVSIDSSKIGYSVTANDSFTSPVTITAFDATSANGGTVAMTTSGAGIGRFTYNPKAGYKGADSFTYTIGNAHGSSTATVSLTLSGIIWFIDGSAGAGDGRLSSPFNSLASFQAVNDGGGSGLHPAANANIFLYDNASAYTGPVTLLNGQKLIGQDATSSLSAISGLTPGTSSATLPSTGGGSPNKVSITATGNDVTLGSGNTVWGLTLGNATSGIALSGSSVGSLKLRDMTINTTGAAVSLASGALDAILKSVSSGGGTHGISLTSTTGSFDVEGDGASDPANTTRGRTTAKNGGGTLTLGSGGTIQSATSAGVLLSSATNVTLRNMTIQNNGSGINNGGDGITATNGSALVLDNDLIQGQTGNNGVHGTGVAGIAFQHTEVTNNASAAGTGGTHVWNVRIDNGTGTSTAANSLFHNSLENIFGVSQTGSATMTLNVTNSQFSDTATTASGNVGLQVNLQNTSNVTLSVDSSTFLRNRTNGVQYLTTDSAGGGSFTVTNSSFDQNAIDIDLFHQGAGKTVSFNISNNTMRQSVGGISGSIGVSTGTSSTATTLLQGKILNNTIGKSSVAGSGSMQGSGIGVGAFGAGTLTATIDGNTVVQVDNEGLNVTVDQGTGTANLTVTNNHFSVNTASPNSDFGAMIVDGGVAGDTQTLCLRMSGNTDTGNAANGGNGVALLTEAGNPTFNIQGYGGAANNASQIAAFIDGANTDSPGTSLVSPGAGTMQAAPANCPTPP